MPGALPQFSIRTAESRLVNKGGGMRKVILLVLFLAPPAWAQNESKLGADLRKEGERFSGSCSSLKSILSCAQVLFTDHPLHIAVGSIAPQNGFGAGLAFVTHYTPNESWRLSWNVDAVASINGSWRAGAYMKAIYIKPRTISEQRGRHPESRQPVGLESLVFNVYAQTISLNKITYFGLGPATTEAGRSFFGMTETIPGINAWWPIYQPAKVELSLYGELNGRLVSIRGSHGQASPSIEQLYTEATAPGLTSQPGFLQIGEGFRFKTKSLFLGDHFRLNYFVVFQQFIAPGSAQFSFRRFTTDLSHQIPLHSKTRTYLSGTHNGPDDCSTALSDHNCPSITRNLEGSVGVRLFISESIAPAGHVVPFYFQPTLGGGDVNGNYSLSSYQDYRFRAPNVMLIRESFEHSIWKWPVGFTFMADEGKVALTRGNLGSSPWFHSFSTGLTLRAGGFPQVSLLFAWGGNEGTHTIAQVNTSLLGGSARPSLF
jgi:hypothetical protein